MTTTTLLHADAGALAGAVRIHRQQFQPWRPGGSLMPWGSTVPR